MEPTENSKKAEAFAEGLIGMLNGGATALMISLGHRTGLFDVMSGRGPSTSEELASAADLDERYVREWLGAMLTGGVLEQPSEGRYVLPVEHAAFVTRAAGSDNLAALTQYIGLLGSVEDRVLRCFHEGGGVPYSAFGRFQEVMAEDSGMTVLPALLDHILPLVPGGVERLRQGASVLDVGCGSGRALLVMAEAFPQAKFRGYDLSTEGIATARAQAERRGLRNLELHRRDVAELDEEDTYDIITAFDAIHDQAKPRRVLANIARALRPDGTFLMQDIGASSHHHENTEHPIGPLLYTVSCMHCMTVSLAAGGEGLGAMWGEQKARELLREAGFGHTELHRLEHDFQNYYYVNRLAASEAP